jgi:hypothetical protein
MRLNIETIRYAKKMSWLNAKEHHFYNLYFMYKTHSKKQTDWLWLINRNILDELKDKKQFKEFNEFRLKREYYKKLGEQHEQEIEATLLQSTMFKGEL